MNTLQFYIGSLLLASVRRSTRGVLTPGPHRRFIERQGGYRSLQFKINSGCICEGEPSEYRHDHQWECPERSIP